MNTALELVFNIWERTHETERTEGISSYELFIGALSVLSVINLVLLLLPISGQVEQLILIVDVALTVRCLLCHPDSRVRLHDRANIRTGVEAL